MTTSRHTAKVREMIRELFKVLVSSDWHDINPPDTLEHEEPGQMDVKYNGHAMRIIVEDCDP